MNKALELIGMQRPSGGRKPIVLRCVDTGEKATVQEWARKIAPERGAQVGSVVVLLQSLGKRGKAYGLTWERV